MPCQSLSSPQVLPYAISNCVAQQDAQDGAVLHRGVTDLHAQDDMPNGIPITMRDTKANMRILFYNVL
jgi:hypothetical protein